MKFPALSIVLLLLFSQTTFAQSRLYFDSLIAANTSVFKGGNQFSGKAWDQLVERSRATNYVLIGEDHFLSEVPQFTNALIQQLAIDNYICEMDQWMLDIFKSRISTNTDAQLQSWISSNYNGFSFFQKKNEFALLQFLVKQQVDLVGIEQVGLTSTTILFQYLVENANRQNKKYYELLRDSSAVVNSKFFMDQSKPFFFATPYFSSTMKKLNREVMGKDEAALVTALSRSAEIYASGSHRQRIKLMQANLMDNYAQLRGKKNVFKFGANHTLKGESYLPVIDIGTTAHILAQAEHQDSYHMLVLPKSGKQAGFLEGTNEISMNEEPYRSLQPFFAQASDSDWSIIDLERIRNEVRKCGFVIDNPNLEKTIKGYDAFIVIPAATAAEALR